MDTYSKWAAAKLNTTKTHNTAADMLNDKRLPFFEPHEMGILGILTDRGTGCCGRAEMHDYQLYIVLNGIEAPKQRLVILGEDVLLTHTDGDDA